MNKYEVIKGCVIQGKPHQPGEIIELDDGNAKPLMGIGRIAPAKHEPKKTQDRSVGLKDDKPKTRKAKAPVEEAPAEEAPEEEAK